MSSLDILVSRLPGDAVATDAETLRERAIDSWALALLRRVRGDELPTPDAAVFAASTEEVATVLTWAAGTATAVIPRGGGSGVCGGAQAGQGSVVLDLSRMDESAMSTCCLGRSTSRPGCAATGSRRPWAGAA